MIKQPVSEHKSSGKRHKTLEKLARYNGWLVVVSILLVLVVWALGVQWGKPPAFLLPSPQAVWDKFLSTLADGSLLRHASVTFFEVLAGLFFGSLLATCLGYFLAKSST
ncbi:MAG: hypothetical protein Q7U31_01630, partial [Anaerolineaceae bacterium]|nr:hypothetical protein [Anaerolineaceae bacterium]